MDRVYFVEYLLEFDVCPAQTECYVFTVELSGM